MNGSWPVGAAILPAAERSRMERIGDALSDFARDRGLRLVLIVLGTVIAVRLVRIALFRVQRRLEKSRLDSLPASAVVINLEWPRPAVLRDGRRHGVNLY